MAVDVDAVIAIARGAPIRSYRWKNRGRSPSGYIFGMAVTFAEVCEQLATGDEAAEKITAPLSNDPDHDVLDWYDDVLSAVGVTLGTVEDRLVAVFSIMLGLGMRESSGKHCEGRDMSADNVTADTAEAGLFQVNYNSKRADPSLPRLIDRFRGQSDLLSVFDDEVRCAASSWDDWGTGPGRDFQELTKQNPKFAVLYAGVLLRYARKHWGPINRKEAEVPPDAVELFRQIRTVVIQR